MKLGILTAIAFTLAGCGGSPPPDRAASEPKREGVFDPLVGTVDRAKNVQQTVDEQAAEQRRQIEAASR